MMDELLTAQELADYLKIPLATVYALNSRHGAPPRLRVGRNVRYRRRDVDAWLTTSYKDTPALT